MNEAKHKMRFLKEGNFNSNPNFYDKLIIEPCTALFIKKLLAPQGSYSSASTVKKYNG